MIVVQFVGDGEKIRVVTPDDPLVACYLMKGSEGLLMPKGIVWRTLFRIDQVGFVEYGFGLIGEMNGQTSVNFSDLTVIGYVDDIVQWKRRHLMDTAAPIDPWRPATFTRQNDVRDRK